MIAEHAEHGDGARPDVLGEDLGLGSLPEIGEVAAQHEDVGDARNFGEQLAVGGAAASVTWRSPIAATVSYQWVT